MEEYDWLCFIFVKGTNDSFHLYRGVYRYNFAFIEDIYDLCSDDCVRLLWNKNDSGKTLTFENKDGISYKDKITIKKLILDRFKTRLSLDRYFNKLMNGKFTTKGGYYFWLNNGKFHRDNGPAYYAEGVKSWYKHGISHRDNGPSVVCDNGTKHWSKNGKLHRDNGPAVEYSNGEKEWWKNGRLHRKDGPAVIWENNSYKAWYKNGQLHRIDGPAIERADGNKQWYKNGKLHRIDGPAYECADGNVEYWKNGKQYFPKN